MTVTTHTHPRCPHCDILMNNWEDFLPAKVLNLPRHISVESDCPSCHKPVLFDLWIIRKWVTDKGVPKSTEGWRDE